MLTFSAFLQVNMKMAQRVKQSSTDRKVGDLIPDPCSQWVQWQDTEPQFALQPLGKHKLVNSQLPVPSLENGEGCIRKYILNLHMLNLYQIMYGIETGSSARTMKLLFMTLRLYY